MCILGGRHAQSGAHVHARPCAHTQQALAGGLVKSLPRPPHPPRGPSYTRAHSQSWDPPQLKVRERGPSRGPFTEEGRQGGALGGGGSRGCGGRGDGGAGGRFHHSGCARRLRSLVPLHFPGGRRYQGPAGTAVQLLALRWAPL